MDGQLMQLIGIWWFKFYNAGDPNVDVQFPYLWFSNVIIALIVVTCYEEVREDKLHNDLILVDY